MPLRRPDYLNDPGQGFIGQQLDALFPGATGLLSLMNIKPDRDIWNALAGNPYAYQQSAMGGSNTLLDIRMHEARKAFKMTLDDDADERLRRQSMEGYYRVLGFDPGTAAERAGSRYSPTGLLSSFAMKSFDFGGGREALTQGFLEMNITPITPGVIDERTMGGEYVAKQRRMQDAARQFSKDLENTYAADPGQFGNLTYGETGQVFAEMASRDTLNIRNITNADGSANETRIRETTGRVQEMSRAVDAMQELFGGTIPEVFDRLDQVFGGSASAMGGRQLESRVRELKQLSAVSGQSIQATAQMIQVGQQYAEQAGFDSGIGTSAAMVTTAQIGVNVDSSGFNMRRVDMGRVRALALRNNVAAATSPFAQYYAGARQIYVERERQKPGNEGRTDDELSQEFFDKTRNVRTLGGLSQVTGVSGTDIQMMSMSEEAQIAMQDDWRVAQAASRGDTERETTIVGSGVLRTLRGRGVNITEEDVFETVDGQRVVRGREDIISRLTADGRNAGLEGTIRGLTNRSIQEYARIATNSRINASDFAVRQRQQAGAPRLRQLAFAQAQFESDVSEFSGAGGFMGVMNFLADASFGQVDKLEGLDKAQIDAMVGFGGKNYDDLTPEQQKVFDQLPPEVQERYKSAEPKSRVSMANDQRKIYGQLSELSRKRYDRLDAGQRLRLSRKRETVGGFVQAFLGSVDTENEFAATRETDASSFVASAISAYEGGTAENRERLGIILNAITDPEAQREVMERLGKSKEDQADVSRLIRGGINVGDPDRDKNIKRLSYLLGTEKSRAREDLKTKLGADYEKFDMTTEEGQRDALVRAALVGKTELGSKFKTTKELEEFLLKDDKSVGDIKSKLGQIEGLSKKAQEAIAADIDKYALAVGQSPAKLDLSEVLQRLVDVLGKLEAKQD